MGRKAIYTPVKVTVALPAWAAEALARQVREGLFPSVEDAVVAGARIVAGLGPRALALLEEGTGADAVVGPADGEGRDGRWF